MNKRYDNVVEMLKGMNADDNFVNQVQDQINKKKKSFGYRIWIIWLKFKKWLFERKH